MKAMSHVGRTLALVWLAASALTSGCADKNPPPPGVAVIGFVPDYCFWDGYEYVGWYGGAYYYWGPRHVWVVCDPIRVQRVNVWVKSHPIPPVPASPQVQTQPQPLASPRVEPVRPSRPLRPPHGRHDLDHDE